MIPRRPTSNLEPSFIELCCLISYFCWWLILDRILTVMLRQVRSHGLDIDAHQRAELQLWLVNKRFGWAYLCACVRSHQDGLRTKQYQRVHEFIFINNNFTKLFFFLQSCNSLTKFCKCNLPCETRFTILSQYSTINFATYKVNVSETHDVKYMGRLVEVSSGLSQITIHKFLQGWSHW